MSAPCFYCGEVMNGRRRHVNGVQEPNHPRHETDDHVIPQWILRGMDYERRGKLNPLNLVKCCHACNSYKGNLSPLDWLVIMPSNEGATPARKPAYANGLHNRRGFRGNGKAEEMSEPLALALTMSGHPGHPLYLKSSLEPFEIEPTR